MIINTTNVIKKTVNIKKILKVIRDSFIDYIYNKVIVVEMDIEEIFYNDGVLNRNKLREGWIKDNLPVIYNVVKCDN